MQKNNTILLLLPFDPESGVSGRKCDAIKGIVNMHSRIGLNVKLLPLEPKALAFNKEFSYLPNWFKIISALSASLPMRIWNKYYYFLIENFAKIICSSLNVKFIFACTMWPITSKMARCFSLKTGLKYIIQEHRTDFARRYINDKESLQLHLEPLKEAAFVQGLTSCHLEAIKNVIPSLNLEYLHLPIPDEFFIKNPIKKPDTSNIVFGAWTNWRELKRLDLLLDAFISFTNTGGKGELQIAGPIVSKRDKLKIQSIPSSVRKKITFKGALGRSDLKKFIDQCDICIIPSDYETFALAAAEALSRGVPVLTTRCGGPESFIVEGLNGNTINTDNINELSTAMLSAVNWRKTMRSENIISLAKEQFSVETISSKLSKQYSKYKIY